MEEGDYQGYSPLGEMMIRVRDLEDKQRMNKERTIILGKNLIELREKVNEEFLEIKRELETIKQEIKRTANFLEIASKEFSSFAKKEDLAILSRQAKMFQPLELVKKSELNEILKKK